MKRSLIPGQIPKVPIAQSEFKVAVRHAYASGIKINEAIEFALRRVRTKTADFEPRYDDALPELPD